MSPPDTLRGLACLLAGMTCLYAAAVREFPRAALAAQAAAGTLVGVARS